MSDIVIYGTGKTGQSLAQLVKRRGDNPIMYDDEHSFVPSSDFCGKTVLLKVPVYRLTQRDLPRQIVAGRMWCRN